MPAPKVVVIKPPPAPKLPSKLNDTMGMVPGREPIRKTVAPVNEPRPPGRIEKEPTPVVPVEPVKAKKSPVVGPHASSTARRHANRHARFNRAITDPTLKAWAEGARAAALEARNKYETANPRPARKSTT